MGCTFCFALFIRMWKEQWVRLGDLKENLQLWCLCCSYWDRGRGLPPLKRRMEGRRTEGAQVTMLGHDSCRLHCRTQYFTACTIKEIKKTMKTAPGVAYIWITDTYSCQSWCHRLMLLIYHHQNDFFCLLVVTGVARTGVQWPFLTAAALVRHSGAVWSVE